MQQTIPVADLLDFTSGDADRRAKFVSTVGEALEDIGFFALENHGVDHSLIRSSYDLAAEFFDLDTDAKRAYEKDSFQGQRGYTSFGKEHAKGQPAPDLKEFWHVGREMADAERPDGMRPNVWPGELPKFQPTMLELYRQLDACAASLLEACSIYLGEDAALLPDAANGGDTILRIIHYPPVEPDANPASIRAGAHEDINFITLLCESTDAGLELLERDGTWRPIHSLGGQIIVDSGDMIQNLTNGRFKSTTHRVVNPNNDRSRRFSMPFFVHPRPEVDLTPLASCGGVQDGSEYKSMTAREYLLQRLREIGLA